MLNPKYAYHEDGECCHGHHHGEGHEHGECCHGRHGEGHEHGECCHGEGHEHGHGHCHEHEQAGLSADERVALLGYMIRHNGHHLDELHSLALQLSGEPRKYLDEAVEMLALSNVRLVKAFYALQGEPKEEA
jgi:hypothetical protein